MKSALEIQNEYQKIALEIGHNIAQYFLSQPNLIKTLTDLKAEADSIETERRNNEQLLEEYKAHKAKFAKDALNKTEL